MEQRTDLTNERFGHLVALYPMTDYKNGRRITIWHCRCDCGKEKDIREYGLIYAGVRSCGCKNGINVIGKRFGSLVVLFAAGRTGHNGELMTCRCDCGKTKEVEKYLLLKGVITSCGCRIGRHTDIIGQKRGHLTALRNTGKKDDNGRLIYEWRCDCVNIIERSLLGSMNGNRMCSDCLKRLKAEQINYARNNAERDPETGLVQAALSNIQKGTLTKMNQSGIRGVHWNESKKRWIATGYKDGKRIELGGFKDIGEAREAREDFVKRQYGAFVAGTPGDSI